MKLISGISILDNTVVINSHYVDDSLLFLQNSENNISNTIDILDVYCAISGSKLAYDKTKFLMVPTGPIPHWIPREWKQIKHEEILRYLVIPFGIEVSLSDMWH